MELFGNVLLELKASIGFRRNTFVENVNTIEYEVLLRWRYMTQCCYVMAKKGIYSIYKVLT